VAVHYAEAFKRQLKRLSRKYQRIRVDIQPLIDDLTAGERPGDQIQGAW
jgi:mRNA-degrading endonuclease RelE of RelBE toxin-antitoxin system